MDSNCKASLTQNDITERNLLNCTGGVDHGNSREDLNCERCMLITFVVIALVYMSACLALAFNYL